jgi:hypothetical protein
MKTVEITRHKQASAGAAPESTFKVFMDIYRKDGIRGINKGVNAVAVRQCTNWGSRYARPSHPHLHALTLHFFSSVWALLVLRRA